MKVGVGSAGGYELAYHTVQNRRIFCKYSLHGSPAVILISGLGDSSETWEAVQDQIVTWTSTFSYDRAGIGKSEAAPTPRTCRQLVDELYDLLKKVPLEPPYLLVGHSFGGLVARLFSTLHSGLVSGVILVDAVPEFKELAYEEVLPAHLRAQNRAYLEDPMRNIEKIDKLQSYKEISEHRKQSSTPLTILTRGLPERSGDDWPHQEILLIEQRLQADFQKLSTRSKWRMAYNSMHDIHHDEPEIIVEEIRLLLSRQL